MSINNALFFQSFSVKDVSRKDIYHELNIYNSQEIIIQIGIDVVEWIYQLERR